MKQRIFNLGQVYGVSVVQNVELSFQIGIVVRIGVLEIEENPFALSTRE